MIQARIDNPYQIMATEKNPQKTPKIMKAYPRIMFLGIFFTALFYASIVFSSAAFANEERLLIALKSAEEKEIELTTKERNDIVSRGWRDRRAGEFDPPVSNLSKPEDYLDDVKRGTIEFSPSWRNYSYHKIRVQNGTTLRNMNFTQIAPNTDAFIRGGGFGENLVFEDCNLVNVKTYPDWTITGSNTAQIDRVGIAHEDGQIEVIDSVFVAPRSDGVDARREKPDPSKVEDENLPEGFTKQDLRVLE